VLRSRKKLFFAAKLRFSLHFLEGGVTMSTRRIVYLLLALIFVGGFTLVALATDPDEVEDGYSTSSRSNEQNDEPEPRVNYQLQGIPESFNPDSAGYVEEFEMPDDIGLTVQSHDSNLVSGPADSTIIIDGKEYHIGEDGNYCPLDIGEDRSNWQFGKIHPLLSEQALEQDELKVVISLKNKPIHNVARQVKALRRPQIDDLARQVRSIISQRGPKGRFENTHQEKNASANMFLSNADIANIKTLNQQRDQLVDQMRKEITSQVKSQVRAEQQQISEQIAQINGRVTAVCRLFNSIGAVVPSSALQELADLPQVESITPDYEYELDLDDSACMLGAGTWWNNNIDGYAYDAALIDSGIMEDHVYIKYRNPPSSDPRPIFKKTSGYSGSHGTRTAGIICSTHSTYQGIGFGLDALFDARGHNNMAESTLMENVDWVVDCPLTTQAPEVINNSYSLYYITDEYGPYERFMDAVVDDLDIAVTKSSGNGGVDEIGYPQARNLISVANLDIMNTCSTSDDIIRSSSSRGPTNSGRRKPDITAPGHNTYSTDTASTTSFANHSGTSAAAPHVAGAIILLEDGGIHNQKAQKALLINTATTWSDNDTLENYEDDGPVDGDRWDNTYGWGVMDLDHAHFHRTDWFTDSVVGRNELQIVHRTHVYK
jgi:hypothetical protein